MQNICAQMVYKIEVHIRIKIYMVNTEHTLKFKNQKMNMFVEYNKSYK